MTELVGIVSLLYGMLLHSGAPGRSDTPPPELPQATLQVTITGLKMLNYMAVLNLDMLQVWNMVICVVACFLFDLLSTWLTKYSTLKFKKWTVMIELIWDSQKNDIVEFILIVAGHTHILIAIINQLDYTCIANGKHRSLNHFPHPYCLSIYPSFLLSKTLGT